MKHHQSSSKLTMFSLWYNPGLNSTHWQWAVGSGAVGRELQEEASSAGSQIWKGYSEGAERAEIPHFPSILHCPAPQPTAICHDRHSLQPWDLARAKSEGEEVPSSFDGTGVTRGWGQPLLVCFYLPSHSPALDADPGSAWQGEVTKPQYSGWRKEKHQLTGNFWGNNRERGA